VAKKHGSAGFPVSPCLRTPADGDSHRGTTTAARGIPAVGGTTLDETRDEANTRAREGDHRGAADRHDGGASGCPVGGGCNGGTSARGGGRTVASGDLPLDRTPLPGARLGRQSHTAMRAAAVLGEHRPGPVRTDGSHPRPSGYQPYGALRSLVVQVGQLRYPLDAVGDKLDTCLWGARCGPDAGPMPLVLSPSF
jgi:hypothetical protein